MTVEYRGRWKASLSGRERASSCSSVRSRQHGELPARFRVDLEDEGSEPFEVTRDQPTELTSDQRLDDPEGSARPRSNRLRQLGGAIIAREVVLLLEPDRPCCTAATESGWRRPGQHLVRGPDAKRADPGGHREPRTSIGRARQRWRRLDRAGSPPREVRLEIGQHREYLLAWPINPDIEAQLDHDRGSLTTAVTTREIRVSKMPSPRSARITPAAARPTARSYPSSRAASHGCASWPLPAGAADLGYSRADRALRRG